MGRTFIEKFTILFLLINSTAFGTTLEEALITALDTHPAIDADEASAKASDIDIDVARSGYFPSLDIIPSTWGYQKYKINQKFKPPLSFPLKGSTTQSTSNPAIVLTQTIFDGLATPFAVERAHMVAEAAYATLGQTREQVAYNAIAAYVNVLAQQQLLKLGEENVKKHQEILEKVKKRVEGGISTIADVFQVESRLDAAIVTKEKTAGQLDVAYANFIEAVGFLPKDDLAPPSLPLELFSEGIEYILTRVSQNNPAVVVALNNLKVAQATLDQTISPFLPTVKAQLEANGPIKNLQGTTGTQSSYTAQLVLSYNLFSGGRDISARNAQWERVKSAEKRVDVAKRTAAKVSRTAWSTYVSDEIQIEELEETVAVNIKLQRAYERQFALVARPLIDLLDAYVSYYRSKNDLINAEAEKYTNQALLLASMGDLICAVQGKRMQQP